MSLIEFDNVSFSYRAGTRAAIRNLSFSLNAGETLALIGRNGSGKSTLARLCNGLLLPDKGEVRVDGVSTRSKNVFDIRRKVGVVFQNPDNQTVATIIEDDVAFGPENLGLKSEEIRSRVDWALERVGMSEYARRDPFRLSGGQKQRVAIAGVLALKPQVMILDEATAMLDPLSRKEVMEVVYRLVREENMALITITHFVEEAMEANRVLVLDGGEKYLEGGKEIFLKSNELESVGLSAPTAVRVADKLRAQGLDVPSDVLNDEDLVRALCR
jgi:energy-coupling factor transport system ATP-binding protein